VGPNRVVEGIVIPSSVNPTVRTSPEGSTLTWQRPDGKKQSFVVRGISSFTFERGPLTGTTFVPFAQRRIMTYTEGACCSCASWQNSEESFDLKACVHGCTGCGCEGCICSTTPPCDGTRDIGHAMTIVAHNNPAAIMTLDRTGASESIAVAQDGEATVSFRGDRLTASVADDGITQLNNPDSIRIPGRVDSHELVRGDKAFFAWSSPGTSVIVEQPRSMPAPSFENGTIDFKSGNNATAAMAMHLGVAPVSEVCSVCGTHPNSSGDNDLMICFPGVGTCYRCISWWCDSPSSASAQ
jgi:hypothetical protein